MKEPEKTHTPPPTYKMTDMVAPPVYSDALQDVVVSQEASTALQEGEEDKETEEEREMVEVPLDENEVSFLHCIMNSHFKFSPPPFLLHIISFLTRLKMIVLHSILKHHNNRVLIDKHAFYGLQTNYSSHFRITCRRPPLMRIYVHTHM